MRRFLAIAILAMAAAMTVSAKDYKYVTTAKTGYTLSGLKVGDIVEFKVISENVVNKKVTSGSASGAKYIYLRSQNNTATVLDGNKIKITYPQIKDSKGTVKYHIVQDCMNLVAPLGIAHKAHLS